MLDLRPALICAVASLAGCTDPPAEPVGLGGPCAVSGDCTSGLCVVELGTCAEPCGGEVDCGDGERCAAVRTDGNEAALACQPELANGAAFGADCTEDSECASGLCHEERCSELCQDECGPEGSCEPAVLSLDELPIYANACAVDKGKPDLALGPFDVEAGGAPVVALEIPEGVLAFTAVVVQEGGTEWVGVRLLQAPDGTVLFDRDSADLALNPASNLYPEASSILVPSTDDPTWAVQPGTYELVPGIYSVDFTATEPFTPVGGTIDRVEVHFVRDAPDSYDLNLLFAQETGLVADTALDVPWMVDLLYEVERTWIEALDVRFGELVLGELPEGYDEVTSSDEIREMCRSHSLPGRDRRSINAFLVPSLTFAGGFTSGVPAPPGLYDAASSCIVFEVLPDGTDTGRLLAHELGHFFGLPHTTNLTLDGSNEVVEATPDAISDTPECPVGVHYTDCPDEQNLMFPFFPLQLLQVTPGQAAVLAGSSALYASE